MLAQIDAGMQIVYSASSIIVLLLSCDRIQATRCCSILRFTIFAPWVIFGQLLAFGDVLYNNLFDFSRNGLLGPCLHIKLRFWDDAAIFVSWFSLPACGKQLAQLKSREWMCFSVEDYIGKW
jgi:hypothetical protein